MENFFLGSLSTYLKENKFFLGFDFSSFELVKNDTSDAESAFENYRKGGLSVVQAMESTMHDLFANVGESRYQAIENCLTEILGISYLTQTEEHFVQKAALQNNDIFEGIDKLRYGVSTASLEEHYDEFSTRVSKAYVNQFSTSEKTTD